MEMPNNKVAFIVAPQNFQPIEFQIPYAILQQAGFECVVASQKLGPCFSSNGSQITATHALANLQPQEFLGIVFVGGSGSAIFDTDRAAHDLVRRFFQAQKICAAICHAPVIFANAGILQGKKATYFQCPENQRALEQGSAQLSENANEVDGKIITANGPAAAEKFGQQILALLPKTKEPVPE